MNKIVCAVLIALLIVSTACVFAHANSVKNELITAQAAMIGAQNEVLIATGDVATVYDKAFEVIVRASQARNQHELNQVWNEAEGVVNELKRAREHMYARVDTAIAVGVD